MTLRFRRIRDRYALGPYLLLGCRSLDARIAGFVITLAWRR